VIAAPARAIAVHARAPGAGPWAFHWHVPTWVAIVALTLCFVVAVRILARRIGPAALPTRRQRWYLAGALAALVAALTWPLGDWAAHWSLTALVVQRLLLTLAAAPLLLLATPSALWSASTRPAAVDAVVAAVTRPVVAVASFSVVALGTLLGPAVAAGASSVWWRALTDAALLLAGVVLWAPAMRHLPGVHRSTAVGVAVYLFVQSIVPTFLAVIYVFAHHPFYPAFADVHRVFGMSRLVDQQVAGVVAKVGTLPVLWSAAWAALARAQRAEAGVTDEDTLTWAEVERQLERAARLERRGARQGALATWWRGRRVPPARPSSGDGGTGPAPTASDEQSEPHTSADGSSGGA
jgi:cytochrome c oxidase assembly factor CtaG